MSDFARLIRTLRHLRYRQIRARIVRRLRARRGTVPRYADALVELTPPALQHTPEAVAPPSGSPQPEFPAVDGTFVFVNESHTLGWLPDWESAASASRLWTYNLHYFEWIWDMEGEAGATAAEHWIDTYPPWRTAPGWAPYPCSLRIQNWTAYFFGTHRDTTLANPERAAKLYTSLARQSLWLAQNLEEDLLTNHYLENGVALACFGACFDTEVARKNKALGLLILREQLPEQILQDGVHFERSPMYHMRVLYALELLLATNDPDLVELVRPFRDRMADATPLLAHPDGEIALLNDSAHGIYPKPGTLAPGYDDKMGAFALPHAGYYGWRKGGDYLICDVARMGPDYNLGHAHGDLLSFELSLAGQRIFVDSGTHGYDDSPLRTYCRSTEAHNTASVEGMDQAEFWGTFRVGRRTRPIRVAFDPGEQGFTLTGTHKGYAHLADATHKRTFNWRETGPLVIVDETTAGHLVRVDIHFHLHPSCAVVSMTGTQANIQTPVGRITLTVPAGGKLLERQYAYCSRFHRSEDGTVITVRAVGANTRTVTTIARADTR